MNLFQTLDDVVQLTCEITEKCGESGQQSSTKKTYSYTELKDLQSRLALVAGDRQRESTDIIQEFDEAGSFDVERFIID